MSDETAPLLDERRYDHISDKPAHSTSGNNQRESSASIPTSSSEVNGFQKSSPSPALDLLFFRRLWRIIGILFSLTPPTPTGSPKDSLISVYIALIVASLAFELVVWGIGTATAGFYANLSDRDLPGFLENVVRCFLLYVAVSLLKGLVQFIHGIMGIRLRKRLTLLLHAAYTRSPEVLYEIAVMRVPPPPIPSAAEMGLPQQVDSDKALGKKKKKKENRTFRTFWGLFRLTSASSRLASGYDTPPIPVPAASSSFLTHSAGAFPLEKDPPSAPLADNPDQTITQDVDKLGDQIRRILESLVVDPFLIAYYTYQTYAVAKSPLGPALIYLYFLISAVTCRAVMSPLIPLIYRRERAEGDFRFIHVHLRTNAESVALLSGHRAERSRLDSFLAKCLVLQRCVLDQTVFLKCVTELVNYLGACLAYLIIAVPVFDGTFKDLPPAEVSALVAKNLFLTLYLIYRFTMITDLSDRFSDVAGFTARVGHLLEVMETVAEPSMDHTFNNTETDALTPVTPTSTLLSDQGLTSFAASDKGKPSVPLPILTMTPLLTLTNLSFTRPLTSTSSPAPFLVRDLSFSVLPQHHVLIEGPSGAGKSALLKVISGLWRPSSSASSTFFSSSIVLDGEIKFGSNLDKHRDVMFLSQVPYIAPGGRGSGVRVVPQRLNSNVETSSVIIGVHDDNTSEDADTDDVLEDTHLTPYEADVLDQLAYPSTPSTLSLTLTQARSILNIVDLDTILLPASNITPPPLATLSQGEKQRLAFARVLIRRPTLVFLDEATSNVDPRTEKRMWEELCGPERRCTVVAVSHREVEGFCPAVRVMVPRAV